MSLLSPLTATSTSFPSASYSTPLRACALRLGLSEKMIESIISVAKSAGIDVDGEIGPRLNAQHLCSCKLGFSPEDVLSDWFTTMHRLAAEEGKVPVDELRGTTELEAYGLYHGLSREKMKGLTQREICIKANQEELKKLIDYALRFNIPPGKLEGITTTTEFHKRIYQMAGVTQDEILYRHCLSSLNPLEVKFDPIKVKMVAAGLGDFNPPNFYTLGWN